MAELATTYQTYTVIQSPLNNRREPSPIIIEDPAETPSFNSVQQRMKLIMTFALVAILFGIIFLVPRGLTNQTAVLPATNSQQQTSELAGAAIGSGISPVFSAEVRHWEPQILAWSAQYGVDANLIATIMQIESCGDPLAISSAGAQGLFQVMPFHFTTGEDMLHPETNAQRGIAYFSERLVQTGGNVGLAFAGYNGGHVAAAGSWDDWAPETQRYFVWATGIFNDIEAGLTESPTLQQWMAAGGVSLCQQASNRLGLQ